MNSLVMGVVNVTPDSFSDGGRFLDPGAAVAHGRRLIAEGADIVDVGGESTRPGAAPVDADEEMRRVVPVIQALAGDGRVSVDTTKSDVAEAAIAAGATILNDVSASLYEVAGAMHVGYIAMHRQGDPRTMQVEPSYDDVVSEVRDFLVQRGELAGQAGVKELWLDPGIGFGKSVDHNLTLLRELRTFTTLGVPIAIGTSRKSFIGKILDDDIDNADQRVAESVATAVWALTQGVNMVRVHDVAETKKAARMIEAIQSSVQDKVSA